MVLGFVFLFFTFWRANLLQPRRPEWVKQRAACSSRPATRHGMPPVGKYNAGQKGVFWAFAVSLLVLLLTGFVFWRPWFVGYFPITLLRMAVLVHAIVGGGLILTIIVHVYAAIWVKGSVRAMTRGTVTEAWARRITRCGTAT